MGHCVNYALLYLLIYCILLMITIIAIMNPTCYLCINSKLCFVVYIIILLLVQSKTLGGPIEETEFKKNNEKKFINGFLVINSLL